MKAQAVVALKAEHPLGVLLEVAGLARSTFFYHQARLALPDPRAELKAAIEAQFNSAKGRYGHRRVHQKLTEAGWTVARKTVLKLMREIGLVCRIRARRRYSSYAGDAGRTAPNTLDRDFTAAGPGLKWVTDVTEFRVGERKLYLSPIIDLFDRSVVAYTCGRSPSLELTNGSLEQALATLAPGRGPMVHSDQGFQYQHPSWQQLLGQAGATQSMSRKATCLDNAIAENFFGHLKEEMFHHETYADLIELETELHAYIQWWNTERISSALGGLSPAQYRVQAAAA